MRWRLDCGRRVIFGMGWLRMLGEVIFMSGWCRGCDCQSNYGDSGFARISSVEDWTTLLDGVEFLAGLEANGFAGRDGDLGAGPGIAAHTGFAGLDGEDAEAAELDALAFDEAVLHGFEDGIDGRFGLGADEPGPFDHTLNQVLFDHLAPLFAVELRMVERSGKRWCNVDFPNWENRKGGEKERVDALSSTSIYRRW